MQNIGILQLNIEYRKHSFYTKHNIEFDSEILGKKRICLIKCIQIFEIIDIQYSKQTNGKNILYHFFYT